jgi:hypothetical protein
VINSAHDDEHVYLRRRPLGRRLSEDAACNRIEVAKLCARFPPIPDLLAVGSVTMASVRLLGKHLTDDNYRDVLERARGLTREQVAELIAEIAPRPDVPSTMRKLPAPTASEEATPSRTADALFAEQTSGPPAPPAPSAARHPALPGRSVVEPTAPDRYRIQFTAGGATRERLHRLQALLRREIPDGDPAVIVDRALTVLLAKVETEKLGLAAKPRPKRSIRPGTDKAPAVKPEVTASRPPSRVIPREVKRVAWRRDEGRCAFVSPEGRRCTERTFLEFHHIQPFARSGPATVENIALRCRRHNEYEADLIFGPRRPALDWGEEERLSIRTPPRGGVDH